MDSRSKMEILSEAKLLLGAIKQRSLDDYQSDDKKTRLKVPKQRSFGGYGEHDDNMEPNFVDEPNKVRKKSIISSIKQKSLDDYKKSEKHLIMGYLKQRSLDCDYKIYNEDKPLLLTMQQKRLDIKRSENSCSLYIICNTKLQTVHLNVFLWFIVDYFL